MSATRKPSVTIIVVSRIDFRLIEVRVERVVSIVRVGRSRPEVAVVTLVVKLAVPVA